MQMVEESSGADSQNAKSSKLLGITLDFVFSAKGLRSIMIFWFQVEFRGLSPFFSFISFLRNGTTEGFFIAHERRGDMVCCCLETMLV